MHGRVKSTKTLLHKRHSQLSVAAMLAAQLVWLAAPTYSADPENGSLNQRLDWVPQEQLSEEQKEQLAPGCCGAFISPEPENTASPSLADSIIDANQFETSGEVLHLQGDVEIQNGNLSMKADVVDLNQTNGDATLISNIEIRQPGLLFRGEKALFNRETTATRIEKAEFVLHEHRLNGSADLLDRSSIGDLILKDALFSTCEPDDKDWYLRGKTITVDTEKHQGVGRDITLNAFGVPVFYAPYLRFPVGSERLSGFLFPTFSSDDISVPYYFNLAPNYDLTLAPRYVVDRGTMVEGNFRHLSPWFMHQLSVGLLKSGEDGISDNEQNAIDSGIDTILGDPFTQEYATRYDGEDRWLVNLLQDGGKLSDQVSDWYSLIDYTEVSDMDYFTDLDTTSVEINRQTHLLQAGEVGYEFEHWHTAARVEAYQTIATVNPVEEPYRQKPSLVALGDYRWNNWELVLDQQYTQFDHGEEFYNPINPADRRIIGDRLRTDYRLSYSQDWVWGFFNPSAAVKTLNYRLDSKTIAPGSNDAPNLVVPQASLDMGMFFERDGSWLGSGYLQTFEPRLFYFYSDFESHDELYGLSPTGRSLDFDTADLTFNYNQLFRTSRFSGGDRIDDANQMSVGLTTRFLGNKSGIERLRLSVGQIFYQEDRQVTLSGAPLTNKRSEIAGQFAAQLTDSWRFSSDVLYDHEDNVATDGNLSLRYLDDQYRIFNLSYRYQRNPEGFDPLTGPVNRDTKQGDVSFAWPLSERWNVIGRAFYDFTYDRELDSIFGLEYNSCCYRVRLFGRHWLDEGLINTIGTLEEEDIRVKKGIFFEFQFKGLGGLGNRVSSMLSETVINHDKREQQFY